MAQQGQAQPIRNRSHPAILALITVLLAASLVGTLWVPFYARSKPALGGFPFFYWYQMIWIPIVAILSWLAYLLTKAARPGSEAPRSTDPEQAA